VRRRARETAGACGVTHLPRKAAEGKAPQDRRRLTFFWGGAEIRRSRLWSLKSVRDVLRVPAVPAPGPLQFQGVAGATVHGAFPATCSARKCRVLKTQVKYSCLQTSIRATAGITKGLATCFFLLRPFATARARSAPRWLRSPAPPWIYSRAPALRPLLHRRRRCPRGPAAR
jgi:hypothetical protein